ncbi:MAG: GNAT family N-acetyltransferase [Luteibaculaceae bacterium]
MVQASQISSGFNFKKKYSIENSRVLLRPLRISDFKYLLKFATKEPQLWQYLQFQAQGSMALAEYISAAIEARNNQKEYCFIVYDKELKSYVGCTRFTDIKLHLKTLQIGGTWFGAKHHGTGVNKHCKYLMLQFAFENMQMERVEFRVDSDNIKSINALKSICATMEGVLRNNGIKPNGERRNSAVFSILKNEWHGFVKDSIAEKAKIVQENFVAAAFA